MLPVAWERARVRVLRVDGEHGNAFAAWLRMGSPAAPGRKQYDALEAASRLAADPADPTTVPVSGGVATVQVEVPRQAVILLVLDAE